MPNYGLKSASINQLWDLHERVVVELRHKIAAERAILEQRLRLLGLAGNEQKSDRMRRPYPKVLPKYRNPKDPDETWAGRGKQPRWVKERLRSGKKLADFLIRRSSAG